MGRNCPFAPKEFFGKIDCYYRIPTVFFHATTFKKIPQRQKVAWFWPKLGTSYFSKQEFFGKVDQNCFVLPIVSHHAMPYQNICHRADHEYKVA